MSWVRFSRDGAPRIGRIEGDRVVPMRGADVLEAIELDEPEHTASLPLEGLELLPVWPRPASIRDFMSYEQHVSTLRTARGLEVPPVWYEQPVFYFTNPAAVLGPQDPVPVSPGSCEFDYEIEVAALIGRPGGDISVDRAAEHIAGYLLFCDWSARDLQLREYGAGLGPAKGKDGATSLGAVLVAPPEWDSACRGLGVSAEVNGRRLTDTRLDEPYWSFEQMVAYASRGTELRRGDLIASGTIGAGCLWELRVSHPDQGIDWLRPGDAVEIGAGALGAIRAEIVEGPALQPLGPPRGGRASA